MPGEEPEQATTGGGRVVAVLGYSSRRPHEHLHPIGATRLLQAQELAADARAVILSGWARRSAARSEAELMREAWTGPEVVLVCDPDARSTAGNAASVAAAAEALGADELVVVTSRWHGPRARVLLSAALRGRKVRLTVVGADGPRSLPLLAREVACFAALPFQVARARRGPR